MSREPRSGGADGVIVHPGEGQALAGPETIVLKLTGEETGGSIGLLEGTSLPGVGPPRHLHRSCDELFYVLEGEVLFLVGERQVTAQPGTLVFVPRGTDGGTFEPTGHLPVLSGRRGAPELELMLGGKRP